MLAYHSKNDAGCAWARNALPLEIAQKRRAARRHSKTIHGHWYIWYGNLAILQRMVEP
jgi:hypothetical protein